MTTLTGLNAVSSSGVVLALPHAAGMQSSLPILQKNYKFSKVFFWGKLQGMKGDYLVAKGIEESFATKKFFFWCAPLASRQPQQPWMRQPTAAAAAFPRSSLLPLPTMRCCHRCHRGHEPLTSLPLATADPARAARVSPPLPARTA